MKIKKIVSALLAVTLFSLCFSACGKQGNDGDNPTTESSTEQTEPYVTLQKNDTGFGIITIPKFNETKLNKESATMANKMFADISDGILKNIEEFKATTDQKPSKEEQANSLCTVQTAIVGTTLSVLTSYHYYFSASQDFYVAVNFNTQTGEVINPRDVVKSAGFTEDEVKAALRCFADRSLFDEWERNAFAGLAAKKALPDGWGDPSYGWQDSLKTMVSEYEAEAQPSSEEWDKLLRHPTVFIGEKGSLFVGANIPTTSESGYQTKMIQIGHSDSQTLRLNPINSNGEQYNANGAITETAAIEAIAFTMSLDKNMKDSNGVKYNMEAEYIDNIKSENGVYNPAFIIKVFTDEDTHIATAGRYAVEVFTGTVYEYDTAKDKWNVCPNGTGYLPEDIHTGMQQKTILAAVYNEPSELEQWCVPTVDEVDLISYATGKDFYESNGDTALIFAKTDNTKLTFISGTMNADKFEKKSELHSVTLDSGDGVLVHMMREGSMPSQAIIVENGNDKGMYVIKYDGKNGTAKTEYIKIDTSKN